MAVPIGRLARRTTFAASHRLYNHQLSVAENVEYFGLCNNPNGHGHNFTVEVTLQGPIDPNSGMVMSLDALKLVIEEAIMKQLDHKNIDKDVPHFKNFVSTTENIAVFVWNSMKAHLPNPELLYEVKIYETQKNIAVFRGEYQSSN